MSEGDRLQQKPMRGRFAPSPSGRMHLGNLSCALLSWLSVRAQGGTMLLRMEDLDPQRCKKEYACLLLEDLQWLGLDWDEGPLAGGESGPYFQSKCTPAYEKALTHLREKNVTYPCWCTRAQRLQLAAAPHGAESTEGACPCRMLTAEQRREREAERRPAWRIAAPDRVYCVEDGLQGFVRQNLRCDCGDFLICRSDGVFAYQLAVTVDDGRMGVTEVVRGRDLLASTPRQLFLLEQLGYPAPKYIHTPLLMAPDGRRLSKRERDLDMAALRERFAPRQLIGNLAFSLGLISRPYPVSPQELARDFSWEKVKKDDVVIAE